MSDEERILEETLTRLLYAVETGQDMDTIEEKVDKVDFTIHTNVPEFKPRGFGIQFSKDILTNGKFENVLSSLMELPNETYGSIIDETSERFNNSNSYLNQAINSKLGDVNANLNQSLKEEESLIDLEHLNLDITTDLFQDQDLNTFGTEEEFFPKGVSFLQLYLAIEEKIRGLQFQSNNEEEIEQLKIQIRYMVLQALEHYKVNLPPHVIQQLMYMKTEGDVYGTKSQYPLFVKLFGEIHQQQQEQRWGRYHRQILLEQQMADVASLAFNNWKIKNAHINQETCELFTRKDFAHNNGLFNTVTDPFSFHNPFNVKRATVESKRKWEKMIPFKDPPPYRLYNMWEPQPFEYSTLKKYWECSESSALSASMSINSSTTSPAKTPDAKEHHKEKGTSSNKLQKSRMKNIDTKIFDFIPPLSKFSKVDNEDKLMKSPSQASPKVSLVKPTFRVPISEDKIKSPSPSSPKVPPAKPTFLIPIPKKKIPDFIGPRLRSYAEALISDE